MKKLSVIALILAVLMILASCGKDTEKKDEGKTEETTAEQTVKIDFAKIRVKDYLYAYVGGESVKLANEAKALRSSKPSVATVSDDGSIVPRAKGVTLVAYEEDGKAYAVAVCVFGEGEKPDRSSGGSAEVVEVGKTYIHTSPVGEVTYTSSNESAVDVTNAPELSFVGSGYAAITCASASRPFTYSFIVYDRTVEK